MPPSAIFGEQTTCNITPCTIPSRCGKWSAYPIWMVVLCVWEREARCKWGWWSMCLWRRLMEFVHATQLNYSNFSNECTFLLFLWTAYLVRPDPLHVSFLDITSAHHLMNANIGRRALRCGRNRNKMIIFVVVSPWMVVNTKITFHFLPTVDLKIKSVIFIFRRPAGQYLGRRAAHMMTSLPASYDHAWQSKFAHSPPQWGLASLTDCECV